MMIPDLLGGIFVLLLVLLAFAVSSLYARRTNLSQRRQQIADELEAAKRRTDRAAYNVEAEKRRLYTQRTGRAVPPPNPFKYDL